MLAGHARRHARPGPARIERARGICSPRWRGLLSLRARTRAALGASLPQPVPAAKAASTGLVSTPLPVAGRPPLLESRRPGELP